MQSRSKKLRGTGGFIWTGLLCAVLLSVPAFAGSGPGPDKKKAAPKASAKATNPKAGPQAKQPQRRANAKPKAPPFEFDPNAKLACEVSTVTAQPVWRGRDKLTFTFHIRNEGTADLKIKAKGG